MQITHLRIHSSTHLRAYKALYNCSERTTNQTFFMQNEPNFGKAQMNVNKVLTRDYENKPNWTLGENEPKTNPIKANSNPNKANFRKNECKLLCYRVL